MSRDNEEVNEIFILLEESELSKQKMEEASSFNILWGAINKLISLHPPFKPESDAIMDSTALPNHIQRALGALFCTAEVLVQSDEQCVKSVSDVLIRSLFGLEAVADATKVTTLISLLESYKSLFPFCYTFTRRCGKTPQHLIHVWKKNQPQSDDYIMPMISTPMVEPPQPLAIKSQPSSGSFHDSMGLLDDIEDIEDDGLGLDLEASGTFGGEGGEGGQGSEGGPGRLPMPAGWSVEEDEDSDSPDYVPSLKPPQRVGSSRFKMSQAHRKSKNTSVGEGGGENSQVDSIRLRARRRTNKRRNRRVEGDEGTSPSPSKGKGKTNKGTDRRERSILEGETSNSWGALDVTNESNTHLDSPHLPCSTVVVGSDDDDDFMLPAAGVHSLQAGRRGDQRGAQGDRFHPRGDHRGDDEEMDAELSVASGSVRNLSETEAEESESHLSLSQSSQSAPALPKAFLQRVAREQQQKQKQQQGQSHDSGSDSKGVGRGRSGSDVYGGSQVSDFDGDGGSDDDDDGDGDDDDGDSTATFPSDEEAELDVDGEIISVRDLRAAFDACPTSGAAGGEPRADRMSVRSPAPMFLFAFIHPSPAALPHICHQQRP